MGRQEITNSQSAPLIYFPTALGGVGAGGVYQVSARAEVKGLHQSLAQATVAEALFDVDLEGNKACFYADDEHYEALYEAQQRCADLAAKASAQCLNGVDRDGSYESKLDIVQVWGQWCAFSPDDSDSVGLSYGIAVFLSWWQQNLQRTLYDKGQWPVFATGHIQGAGTVTPVTGLEEKAGGILSFLASPDMESRPFWFFYNTEEVPEAGGQFEALLQHPQCHGVQVSSLVECLLRLTGDDSSYFDSNWSPFKGLSSYGFYDQYSYAGRETVAEAFAGKLLGLSNTPETPPKRLAVVYAPSGRGKSSFIAAGVAPQIRNLTTSQTERFYFFRTTPSQAWQHQNTVPDDKLTESINGLLIRTVSAATLPTLHNTAGIFNDLAEQLSVLTSQQSEEPVPSTVFICFDQFEELFDNTQVDREDKAAILHHINTLATCSPHLHIAITLKQEYLGEIAEHFDDEQLIKQHLPAMEVSHWQKSIDRLMTYAGVKFEPRGDVYEKDLRDILVDEAAKAGKDNAPMLSFLLQQLYDKSGTKSQITYQDYLSVTQATTETMESGYVSIVGGIEGVISRKADEILHGICQNGGKADAIEEKQDALLSKLLTKLVDIQDEKTGETGLLSIPLSLNDDTDTALNNLAEQFAEARLLLKNTDTTTGQTRFRIAHEAFLKCPKVTRWAEKNREFKLWLQRAREACKRWEEKREDLLTGKALSDARYYIERAEIKYEDPIKHYVSASLKRSRLRWIGMASIVTAVLIALSATTISSTQNAEIANSRLQNILIKDAEQRIRDFEYDDATLILLNLDEENLVSPELKRLRRNLMTLAVSQSNKRVVFPSTSGNEQVGVSLDSSYSFIRSPLEVQVIDNDNGQIIKSIELEGTETDITFSADNQHLMIVDYVKAFVHVSYGANFTLSQTLKLPDELTKVLAFDDDISRFATFDAFGKLSVYETSNSQEIFSEQLDDVFPVHMAFHPTNDEVLYMCDAQKLYKLDLSQPHLSFFTRVPYCSGITFINEDTQLVVHTQENAVWSGLRVMSSVTLLDVARYEPPDDFDYNSPIAFSSIEKNKLIVSDFNGNTVLWDIEENQYSLLHSLVQSDIESLNVFTFINGETAYSQIVFNEELGTGYLVTPANSLSKFQPYISNRYELLSGTNKKGLFRDSIENQLVLFDFASTQNTYKLAREEVNELFSDQDNSFIGTTMFSFSNYVVEIAKNGYLTVFEDSQFICSVQATSDIKLSSINNHKLLGYSLYSEVLIWDLKSCQLTYRKTLPNREIYGARFEGESAIKVLLVDGREYYSTTLEQIPLQSLDSAALWALPVNRKCFTTHEKDEFSVEGKNLSTDSKC